MNYVNRQRRFAAALSITAVLLYAPLSFAARVVFYQAEPGNPDIEKRLELACRFYGVDLEKHHLGEAESIGTTGPVAVVIEAAVLDKIRPSDIPEKTGAVLIAGINSRTSAQAVGNWSGGSVSIGKTVITNVTNRFLTVASDPAAHELAGQRLPVDIAEGFSLQSPPQTVLLSYENGAPLFVRTGTANRPVCLLADLSALHPPDANIWFYDYGFFAEIAPYMIFIKQTLGEYGWHADGDYANLTIDDPWFRDTYGHLRFADLLQEMDRADFHTTIAFIPWNYDRKFSANVVNLFRERPDRFSICIHGNNHDHREFYRYTDIPGAPWPARPLSEHEANIRQGLARMERLKKTTGLPVDPVMVFPHDIAPEPTLELLKKYNFYATSNVGNVPLDADIPSDPLFWLRRTTDKFAGGFAAIDRTEVRNRTDADIAVDLFLDNPVLFVEHLYFFANNPGAFNATAREVNELQPAVHWASLGTISRHLYLMKKQSDGVYDVRTFSPDIILRNTGKKLRQYHVEKKDDGNIPVRQIQIDGNSVSAVFTNGFLQFGLDIPPGEERHIQITYQNNFDPSQENLSKPDLHVNILRRLSDFRDIYLTAGPLGTFIDRAYYGTGLYTLGMKILVLIAAAVLVFAVALVVFIRKRKGKNHE